MPKKSAGLTGVRVPKIGETRAGDESKIGRMFDERKICAAVNYIEFKKNRIRPAPVVVYTVYTIAHGRRID